MPSQIEVDCAKKNHIVDIADAKEKLLRNDNLNENIFVRWTTKV